MTGPITDADRLAPLRASDNLPVGDIFQLSGCGVSATAVVRDDKWLLAMGSEVRAHTVPSSNTSASMLRSEWEFANILARQGNKLVLTRDMYFNSGSAAAHFVLGSKSQSLVGWKPVPPKPLNHLTLVR
jgi:hypothetical protein